MSQPSATPSYPVTDRVLHAMKVSQRGCDELLPEADWLAKLARSEATGVPLRIIGQGPELRQLKRIAGTNVTFLGAANDTALRREMTMQSRE